MEESLIAALRKLFWKNCRRTSGNCGEHQLGTSHDNNDNNNNNNDLLQFIIYISHEKYFRCCILHFEPTTRTYADLHIVSSRPMISYSRNELFMIRRVSHCSPSERIFADLRRAGLLHLRGCRAARRDFIHGIKVIASNRSEV